MADERAIAAVLAGHERRGWTCACGGWVFAAETRNYSVTMIRNEHRAHVAAAIAAIPVNAAAWALDEAFNDLARRVIHEGPDDDYSEQHGRWFLRQIREVRAAHAAGAEADGPTFGDYWPAEPEAGL